MLAALSVLFGNVSSIRIGPYLKIGLGSLPNRAVDFLFGPVAGAVFGAGMNSIKYALSPDGPFFPGFMLSAVAASAIYGTLLYGRRVRIGYVIISCVLVKLLVNCGLNTLWLSMLYGKPFAVLFPVRALKNLAELPADSALLYGMLKMLEPARKRNTAK